jgi:asparagine synthase (glutamine-hydrolysing)
MCGIVAIAGKQTVKLPQVILDQLYHRGPDSGSIWYSDDHKVAIGHRRLSIVDLSDAGNQPIWNENGSIWLVCNGEIYNYPELRKQLESMGHIFRSNMDCEVILHAWESWGEACVEKLTGMFAFVLWDGTQKRLLAARDRVGIKPLYFAHDADKIALGSGAGAVTDLIGRPRELEPIALAYVMTLGYIPTPWSIWQGVEKIEPGHFLTWSAEDGVRTRCYWTPPDQSVAPHSLAEWEKIYPRILEEHLLADVPISLFLSGGIDSSSIAAGLADLGQSLTALTIGFPDKPAKDESLIAQITAKHLGFPHQIRSLGYKDVKTLSYQVAKYFDEPQSYSALMSMMSISEVAASSFKVVLSGDGGDELFGGYRWYDDLGWYGAKQLAKLVLKPGVAGSGKFMRKSPLHRHAWRLHPRFLPAEAEHLLSSTGLKFSDEEMLEPLRRHYQPKLPLKRALQRVDLMTICADSFLPKVDRASMAHSLEVRVPFLDHRLLEWGLTAPLNQREDSQNKPLLRDYLAKRLPPEVLNQPKQGFSYGGIPELFTDKILGEIESGYLVKNKILHPDWRSLVSLDVPQRPGRIWNLLTLTRWTNVWCSQSERVTEGADI